MLTPEQARLIEYLQTRLMATLDELITACWPGAAPALVNRALADLEWLGYVVIYYDAAGEPLAVQTTERGMQAVVAAGM